MKSPGSPEWRASWEYLSHTYQRSWEAYVRTLLANTWRGACDPGEAADIVQSLIAKALEEGLLADLDPAIGTFRGYSATVLWRFTKDYVVALRAKKRPPGRGKLFPLDAAGEEPDLVAPDASAMGAPWVEDLVAAALEKMRTANRRYHTIVVEWIENDGREGPDLAKRLGATAKQMPVLRFRARHMFATLLRREIAATLNNEDDIRAEIDALRPFLGRYLSATSTDAMV